jgi:YfiH family protein
VNLKQAGSINYFQFDTFEDQGVYHAVFTRKGGISPTPWESLNFGASVGDDIDRVMHNKQVALSSLGIEPESIYDVYQVHSSTVIQTERPLPAGEQHVKADAIITNSPSVTLLMRFADCVPILLFDPINHAIGIAHAGWVGTIDRIAARTVEMMGNHFGTDPKNIQAAIGPSIGPDHYSVKSDVIQLVNTNFQGMEDRLIIEKNGTKYFDLWKTNELILRHAGVERIETAGLCTFCHSDIFYSHRAEHGKTGRFGVVFGLIS